MKWARCIAYTMQRGERKKGAIYRAPTMQPAKQNGRDMSRPLRPLFLREWMGVEPTKAASAAPLNDFEDRGAHRDSSTPTDRIHLFARASSGAAHLPTTLFPCNMPAVPRSMRAHKGRDYGRLQPARGDAAVAFTSAIITHKGGAPCGTS